MIMAMKKFLFSHEQLAIDQSHKINSKKYEIFHRHG